MQTLSSCSGNALALGMGPLQPRSQRREPATVRAKQVVLITNFYSQGPSSLPSGTIPLFFVEGTLTFFFPALSDQAGWWACGVGRWHGYSRVIDVDVCWDGADEPDQFPT